MAHERSSIAKITRPRISGILERNRLFKHLDNALNKPLLWISGPAGSGKTTVVSSYIKAYTLPCLWYQVDSGDADLATFFYYLARAGEKAAPQKRKPLPLLTPEYLLGVSEFSRNFFSELFARLKAHSLLVFDNYQDVPDDASLHSVLLEGLSMIPEDVNIILVSRSDPPPSFARVRANQMMNIIGWQDLRLTWEEFQEILQQRGFKEQQEDTIQNLYSKLDGWAAGLQLLLESAGRMKLDSYTIDACAHDEIFDYFAGEIFQRSNGAIQDFLLKTPFLPKIIVPFAVELTQNQQAGQILADLTRRNYFTVRHAGVDLSYEYHPLFREFLLEQAERRFTSGQLTELRRTAANLLSEKNEVESAMILALQAQDWDLVQSLILRHAQTFLQQGRYQTVQEWIRCLPSDLVDRNPWLLFWFASSLEQVDPHATRTCYEGAYHLFTERGDSAGSYLAWAGIVDTFLYVWGDFTPLDNWIKELKDLRVKFPDYPSPEVENRVAIGTFCALMYRQPEHPEMRRWVERARAITLGSSDVRFRAIISYHLSLYYTWWVGDHGKAAELLAVSRSLAKNKGTPPLVQICVQSVEAAYAWMAGDMDRCLSAVRKGLRIAQSSGVYLFNVMLYAQGVWGALTGGNATLARTFLRKIEAILDNRRTADVGHYHLQSYIEAWHANDLRRAMDHAETGLALTEASGIPFGIAVLHIATGRALYEQRDWKAAEIHLAKAHSIARTMQGDSVAYIAYLAEAVIAMDQEPNNMNLQPLRRFLALGRKRGYVNHAWWRADEMSSVCRTALEHNIETEYVTQLIRQRHLVPQDPPLHLDNWPWAFKIYTLGKFELLQDDKPLRFPGRVQKRPLEMLKAIIALGGSGVSEEQITEALWPDAEGDVAHLSFKTTLHRLRQVIGNEKALQVKEGHVSLDDRLFWVDALAFQRIFEEAENRGTGEMGRQRQGEEEKRKLLEKAILLYHGHFLASDEDTPWAISLRERLRGKFLRAVNMLGDYWLKQGEVSRSSREKSAITEAIECYQRALEVDDCAEEFYQRLMVCHQKLGRRAEAVKVYNRCRDTLSATFGIEPSDETELLYAQVKGR